MTTKSTSLVEKKLAPVIDTLPTPKLKKKTKTITKLVDTAEFISQLGKRKDHQGKNGGGKLAPVNSSGSSTRSATANNRFRTGGLVATAVQNNRKPKQSPKSAQVTSLVFSEQEDNIKVTLRRHKSKGKKDFSGRKK